MVLKLTNPVTRIRLLIPPVVLAVAYLPVPVLVKGLFCRFFVCSKNGWEKDE